MELDPEVVADVRAAAAGDGPPTPAGVPPYTGYMLARMAAVLRRQHVPAGLTCEVTFDPPVLHARITTLGPQVEDAWRFVGTLHGWVSAPAWFCWRPNGRRCTGA